MKHIFVNLKRFDVPRQLGGVCPDPDSGLWLENILNVCINHELGKSKEIQLTFMLPESLIPLGVAKLAQHPPERTAAIKIGSQGVFREDVARGGNFGAFTTNRPAAAVKSLGCSWSIIGHSEERKDKMAIMAAFEPGILRDPILAAQASAAVSRLISQEVICALKQEINVLLCIGETAEERGEGVFDIQKPRIEAVLERQLAESLSGLPCESGNSRKLQQQVIIGYEPVWAIGPGKVPPGAAYIAFISDTVKRIVSRLFHFDPVVVYGGGLKAENAAMIGEISGIGGGLIALTRFSGDIGFYVDELIDIIAKYQGR